MAKKARVFDGECRHRFLLFQTEGEYANFVKAAQLGKRICPYCPGKNVRITPKDQMGLGGSKDFGCCNGHVTTVAAFTNGIISIDWGVGHENHEMSIADAMIYISTFKCPFEGCLAQLLPLDDVPLTTPGHCNINTKVFVGDIWDKAKVSSSKETSEDFQKRHRQYIKSIKKERLTRPAGEPIDKATKRNYKDE